MSTDRSCWQCGALETDTVKLKLCQKCIDEKLTTRAAYCSRECQAANWASEHRRWHKAQRDLATAVQQEAAAVAEEWSQACADTSDEYTQLLAQALRAGSDGDCRKQMKLAQRAIKLRPEATAAYHVLADALFTSGDFKRAGEQYVMLMEKLSAPGSESQAREQQWALAAAGVSGCFRVLDEHERAALDWFRNRSKDFRSIADRAYAACPNDEIVLEMRAAAYCMYPDTPADLHQAAADWRRAAQYDSSEEDNEQRLQHARDAEERAISWAVDWIG